jgi:hypothetical protein
MLWLKAIKVYTRELLLQGIRLRGIYKTMLKMLIFKTSIRIQKQADLG